VVTLCVILEKRFHCSSQAADASVYIVLLIGLSDKGIEGSLPDNQIIRCNSLPPGTFPARQIESGPVKGRSRLATLRN
jgi:hypothetical protein